jgi:hypothetical protein
MNGNTCLKTCCSESKPGEVALRGQRVTNLDWPLDLIRRLTGLPEFFYQLNRKRLLTNPFAQFILGPGFVITTQKC